MTITDLYALRVMAFFVKHPNTFFTLPDLARLSGVAQSPTYLSKVCSKLARADLLVAKRGKHGGFLWAGKRPTVEQILAASGDTLRYFQQCPIHPTTSKIKKSPCCALAHAQAGLLHYLHSTDFIALVADVARTLPEKAYEA